ncbi:MAG: SPOR domain-containing protein [Gammaproteobacteria bacterium]|nr:SPOR domain-containing protein [Gammaproteobacteria bacterium]
MQKTLLSLAVLGCLVCFSTADAASVARVTALQSSAWVEQENNKTTLGSNSDIEIGDHIITGDTGRVEMQFQSIATLRLYANSEIRLQAKSNTDLNTPDNDPLLYVHKGKVCVDYKPQPGTQNKFELNISKTIVTVTHHRSYICVLREDGWSFVNLRDGSIQVSHAIDPSMIILSESGTELRIKDDGSFELLKPGAADSIIPEDDKPFITETDIKTASPIEISTAVEDEIVVAKEIIKNESKPVTPENTSGYIYTVYLFSTRSVEAANEANQRFQKAGHKSKIITRGKEPSIRYRVAVSGFETRQSAQDFSNSMIGRLGISDTWIGKDRQNVSSIDENEIETSGITETPPDTEEGIAATEDTATNASDPEPEEAKNNYIYTVYLFSTGSEDVANEANQRFQKAGHKSIIITNGKEPSIRYRVAVSGFESRQSAKDFSNSVVGKLGISDTWIGKERTNN